MKLPLGHVGSLAMLASCMVAEPAAPPRVEVTSGDMLAPAANVAVEVRGPARLRYAPSLLGPARPELRIVVSNRSREPIDVSDLRVRLRVEHEGVAFRCAEDTANGKRPSDREPSTLAPGRSATFERSVDCALPLLGTYDVQVGVSFGRGAARIKRDLHAFTLTISSESGSGPREIAGLPGLWGAVGAGAVLPGTSPGRGRIGFALVNATPMPLEVPSLRLALRVFRAGTSIPCEDEPIPLGTPTAIGAGGVHREWIDVSCLGLGTPGRYEVIARILADGDRVTEIGRLEVQIVSGPTTEAAPDWLWDRDGR